MRQIQQTKAAAFGSGIAIAVTSAQRSSALPDVPTMVEQGFPGFEISSWWGVVVPAGTPRPIVEKLAGWLRDLGQRVDLRHRDLEQGAAN